MDWALYGELFVVTLQNWVLSFDFVLPNAFPLSGQMGHVILLFCVLFLVEVFFSYKE